MPEVIDEIANDAPASDVVAGARGKLFDVAGAQLPPALDRSNPATIDERGTVFASRPIGHTGPQRTIGCARMKAGVNLAVLDGAAEVALGGMAHFGADPMAA